jgi:hypothetical protein
MVEIEAEEEARDTSEVKLLGCRENFRHPIKHETASDVAELGCTENTGKDM